MYRRERQHGHSASPAESTGPHRRIRCKNSSSRLPGLLNPARGGNSGVDGRRDCSCDGRKVPSQGPLSGKISFGFLDGKAQVDVRCRSPFRLRRHGVPFGRLLPGGGPYRSGLPKGKTCRFGTSLFSVRRFGRGTAYASRGEMLVLPLWFRYSKGGPLRPSISRVPSPGRSRRAECRTIRRFRRA